MTTTTAREQAANQVLDLVEKLHLETDLTFDQCIGLYQLLSLCEIENAVKAIAGAAVIQAFGMDDDDPETDSVEARA